MLERELRELDREVDRELLLLAELLVKEVSLSGEMRLPRGFMGRVSGGMMMSERGARISVEPNFLSLRVTKLRVRIPTITTNKV